LATEFLEGGSLSGLGIPSEDGEPLAEQTFSNGATHEAEADETDSPEAIFARTGHERGLFFHRHLAFADEGVECVGVFHVIRAAVGDTFFQVINNFGADVETASVFIVWPAQAGHETHLPPGAMRHEEKMKAANDDDAAGLASVLGDRMMFIAPRMLLTRRASN